MHDLATLRRLNQPPEEGLAVSFLTAIFTKRGIAAGYPGGVARFRDDQLCAKEDRHLIAIVSMSGGELQERLAAIAATGIDLSKCCAVADMFIGPIEGCTGIEFFTTGDRPYQPGWRARAAPTGIGMPVS